MSALNYGWWDSPTPRCLFDELSSLELHAVLAGLEARIVARLIDHHGEDYGRYLWETSGWCIEDDDEIREAVDRAWLRNWMTAHSVAAESDRQEIELLLAAGKAA